MAIQTSLCIDLGGGMRGEQFVLNQVVLSDFKGLRGFPRRVLGLTRFAAWGRRGKRLIWVELDAAEGRTGQLWRKSRKANSYHLFPAGGVGVSYQLNDEKMVVRADFAVGKEGNHDFYLQFGQPF